MNTICTIHPLSVRIFILTGLLVMLPCCDSLTVEEARKITTEVTPSELRVTEAPAGAVVFNLYSPLGPIMERSLGPEISSISKDEPERSLGSQISSISKEKSERSPFACFLSSYRKNGKSGEGYYYRSIYLHFPESMVEAGGPAVVVRYEAPMESVDLPNRMSRVIVCRVPQNPRAIDLLQRKLQIAGDRLHRRPDMPSKSDTRLGDSKAGYGIRSTGRAFSASADEPQFYPRVMDGGIPNREGATCAAGYDWANREQTVCTDGRTVQLPVITIHGRAPAGPGAGGLPGESPREPGTTGSRGPYPEPEPRAGEGTPIVFRWNDISGSAAYDCSQPYTSHGHKAHCISKSPIGTRYVRTSEALGRIRSKGGECARIADVGRSMLAKRKIRYFYDDPRDAFALRFGYGSPGSLDDPDDWISLDQIFPDKYYDAVHKLVDLWFLDWLLVHEIEHFMGRAHVDVNGNHIGSDESPWTINSRRCAGME